MGSLLLGRRWVWSVLRWMHLLRSMHLLLLLLVLIDHPIVLHHILLVLLAGPIELLPVRRVQIVRRERGHRLRPRHLHLVLLLHVHVLSRVLHLWHLIVMGMMRARMMRLLLLLPLLVRIVGGPVARGR